MSGTVRIVHDYAGGSRLYGTSREETRKGMPVRKVLDAHRWRWSGSHVYWYQRYSRDKPADRYTLDGTARDLRELGCQVEVTIDDRPRSMAEQEADRALRSEERTAALEAKADRRAAAGQARVDRADQFFDALPFGQPIINEADRRRRARHMDRLHTGRQLLDEAARVAGRADASSRHMDRRYSPITVANRIRELEARIRRFDRELDADGVSAKDAEHWRTHRADAANQLEYWRQVRAEQIASGKVLEYGPHNVSVGDWVYGWPGGPTKVIRVNKVTVTIETWRTADGKDWLTNTLPYHQITGLKTAEIASSATTSSSRKEKWQRERAARRTADKELREAADELLEDPERVRAMTTAIASGRVSARIRDYSPRNQALLYTQTQQRGMPLTDVDTFRGWAARGRQVRRGERSLRIVAPRALDPQQPEHRDPDQTAESGEKEDSDGESPLFRMISLFEASQTDPIDEPSEDEETT